MRRISIVVVLAVAALVVWQSQRSSPRSKAAPQHSGAASQTVTTTTEHEPVKLGAAKPSDVTASRAAPGAQPKHPRAAQAKFSELPPEVQAKFAKFASSYVPPHQRADPGIMGRIMRMRIQAAHDNLEQQEPSAEWTASMQERLENAFVQVPDSYPLSVDCRETTCKVEIIHEAELGALEFSDQLPSSPVRPALEGDFVSFVERSEEDGLLKNVVFVERDGPGMKEKLADFLGWGEEDVE